MAYDSTPLDELVTGQSAANFAWVVRFFGQENLVFEIQARRVSSTKYVGLTADFVNNVLTVSSVEGASTKTQTVLHTLRTDISAYRTTPAKIDEDGLLEIHAGLDVVTFTSSSTVTNFIHLMKVSGLDYKKLPGDPLFACIGPITARTVKEHQVPVGVVAKNYTTEGLLAAIESIEFSRKAELI